MKDEDKRSSRSAHPQAGPRGSVPCRTRVSAVALVLIGVVSALGVAACGQDRVSQNKTTPKSTLMVPVQSKLPKTPIDETVGQPARTAQGNSITVYQFQSPAAYAESGYVIAAADVGVCAASTTVVTESPGVIVKAGISPRFFSVQFSDGTLQEAQFPSVKSPALPEELLSPGQCVRGWVTFQVPEQQKIGYVLFRSLSVFRWAVGGSH